MPNILKGVRGMPDGLPESMKNRQKVEQSIRNIMINYGYDEIRLPVLEMTDLFKRSVGEETDIVSKEMYTFLDRNEESLTLRPEGTAGCMRAGIEHGLFHNQIQKLWYMGPMFRYERPQKGRFRQFNQWGVEVVGLPGHTIEAELIQLGQRLFDSLEIADDVTLTVNSLGSSEDRAKYRALIVDHFSKAKDKLSEAEILRLERNPLRLLDSKNPDLSELIAEAPLMIDTLCDASRREFSDFCNLLEALGIDFVHNHHLVRGLDYYQGTVFEWVTDKLGAQNAVGGGGRYDGLIAQLGGKPNVATGFSMGIERIAALMPVKKPDRDYLTVQVICLDQSMLGEVMPWIETLRKEVEEFFTIVLDHQGGTLKRQQKRIDRCDKAYTIIIDPDQWAIDYVEIRCLEGKSEKVDKPNVPMWFEDEMLGDAWQHI